MANHDLSGLGEDRPRRSHKLAWICAFAAWMTASGVALGALTEYASRPCAGALAPTSWPRASHLSRTAGRGTLVMIAHTKCSCTRASLHELERVMTDAGSRIEAIVVFVGPNEGSGAGGLLDLRATARAIPNVRVVEDPSEARLFGAATSGQVLLYANDGALVFRGGLTSARGHEGDSAGGDIVRRFSSSNTTSPSPSNPTAASAVFGCALFDNPKKDP
ncbi:MAG: hypothetical protein JWO86_1573 [Myxococcaceae bacterium]|nr:hypothetical protein [Myxococcaceae bacterium]